MPHRTSALLSALGQEAALDVVLVLLKRAAKGATVGDIAHAADLRQPTVTRRVQELAGAGLLEHARRGQPFRLREPQRLRALLRAASELSELLLTLDEEAEQRFQQSLE